MNNQTRGHKYRYNVVNSNENYRFATTETCKNFFLNRINSIWNNLPTLEDTVPKLKVDEINLIVKHKIKFELD